MSETASRLKRPIHPMPEFIREALKTSGLESAYALRPPYQRNDYIGWITKAKLPATQQKLFVTNARRTGSRQRLYEDGPPRQGHAVMPNPSFHRTLRIKPRKAGEFRR